MKLTLFVLALALSFATVQGQEQSSASGIRLELRDVYVSNGVLWLSFKAENRSAIDFKANGMRIEIRDRKALKRRARQDLPMRVLQHGEPTVLQSDSTVQFRVGMAPRVPGKDKELVVEWVERDGDRRVAVRIKGKRILKAKKV